MLSAALLILVAGGSYLAIAYRDPAPVSAPVPVPAPMPVAEKPAASTKESVVWTSYAPGLGFSFSYPAEWRMPKTTFSSTASGEGAGSFADADGKELVDFSVRVPYAKDGVTPVSFSQFMQSIGQDGFTEYMSRQDVVVAGAKAVRVEHLHKQVLAGQHPERMTSVYVPMPGGKVLEISGHRLEEWGDMRRAFDEIVDSVRIP